MENLILSMMEI